MSDEFEYDSGTDSTSPDSDGDESQDIIYTIDLDALAEELYAVLRRELRLERERQGWSGIW